MWHTNSSDRVGVLRGQSMTVRGGVCLYRSFTNHSVPQCPSEVELNVPYVGLTVI